MDKRPGSARELKQWFKDSLLEDNPPEEAEAIAMWTVQEVTDFSITEIIADKPLLLKDSKWEQLLVIRRRLAQNEPVQYIFGQTWFWGLRFKVNENVLIPRPETEELIQRIFEENGLEKLKVLDIGTGSGCIPISLAHERPLWDISSCDISQHALELAQINSSINNVQVNFFNLDILNDPLEDSYDIIISNPPYVPVGEKTLLHPRVTEYEPDLAIFVPEESPLIFYQKISREAKKALTTSGRLYFEIEEKRGEEVVNLLKDTGWEQVQSFTDINGKERIVSAVKD